MKRILITGANSYIGTSFEKYINENYQKEYVIDTVDMMDSNWEKKDFSIYDSIFHVAGITHQKETKENQHLYYEVNRDLAINAARKAMCDGVNQFIFLSSMSVYGMEVGEISKKTKTNPKNNYGKSKLQAEEGLLGLSSDSFSVAIVRPPMVYGDGCKGNYKTLSKLAKVIPFCPTYKNERSLINIDNLSRFIKYVIDNELEGIFRPQDKDYICTSDMMYDIAIKLERKIKRFGGFNWCIPLLMVCITPARKAFGTLKYIDLDYYERL